MKPTLRTKNPSAEDLRKKLQTIRSDKKVIVRLGSMTPTEAITTRKNVIEINTPQAVETSRNKLLMKQAFSRNGVKTADWWRFQENTFVSHDGTQKTRIQDLPYPIISKSLTGQGGAGNTKLDNQQALEAWMQGKNLSNYIFEKFYNYAREYRLHVTKDENFLSWRKLRRNDAQDRWYFNSDNCVWVSEENNSFNKPKNWEEIQKESIKALNAVGLHLGAIDVRVASNGDHIILETNSAASLGNVGTEAYFQQIKKLIE